MVSHRIASEDDNKSIYYTAFLRSAQVMTELLSGGMDLTSSYLIKDAKGHIAGYALLAKHQIHIRLSGRDEKTASVIVSDGEEETAFAVPCDAQEHVFEWKRERIEWVRLGQQETDLTDAKGKPEHDILPAQEECAAESQNRKQFDKTGIPQNSFIEKENAFESSHMLRWPPPPCWPTARYVDGEWMEGGD